MAAGKSLKKSVSDKRKSEAPASRYALAGIVALTAIVFLNSITKNFLAFDDFDYILNNKYIRSLSWESIKAIFSNYYYANYHPLTTLFYAVEYNLYHQDAAGYHAVNLLIHLINVGLVYVLLQRLSGRKEVAVIGALFFGIHPMHVESVAWISERKDVLYALFYLAGLISYVKYLQLKENKWLAVTFFLFVLSLLSKPAANTFPLLMVLFDYFLKRGWSKKAVFEKIPFFILSVVFGIVTIYAQKAGGALDDVAMPHYTLFERIFVVSYSVVFYLVKFFLPFNLSALHYAPKELPFYFYLCPFVIAGIVWAVWKSRQMKEKLIFGLLFYLFSLILVVQIIPLGYTLVSERYSYIPYIGLLFIVGSFYVKVIENKIPSTAFLQRSLKYILVFAAIVFSVLSFQRNKMWNNTLSLFTDNSEKNPNSALAQFVLGEKLYEGGDIDGALSAYDKSIALDSGIAQVYFWRGNAHNRKENYEQALKDFNKAIELKPDYGEAYNNIGIYYFQTERYDQAAPYFSKSVAIRPTEFIYQNLGTSNFYMKKYSEAIDAYNKALQINDSLTDAYFNRGVCHYYLRQGNEACQDWQQAAKRGSAKADELFRSHCR